MVSLSVQRGMLVVNTLLLMGFLLVAHPVDASEVNSGSVVMQKTLNLTTEVLTDNQGLVYLGAKVEQSEISEYLQQLERYLGQKAFREVRRQQEIRDHHQFHVTVVNPFEYKKIPKVIVGESFKATLIGVGQVTHPNDSSHTAYFIVVESSSAQQLRADWNLNPKDFHITLGFTPQDVYGVAKNHAKLIKE